MFSLVFANFDCDDIYIMATLLLLATMYFNNLISLGNGKQLFDMFKYYQTLKKEDFEHKITRRGLQKNEHIRNISFTSHGKTFHMKLIPSRDIFAESFQAATVDRFGNEHPFAINTDIYYKGTVVEDVSSRVIAHVEDNGLITATIDTFNETYIVEPIWRHVDGKHPHDMIVYKASHFKWNITNPKGKQYNYFCGFNGTIPGVNIRENENNFRDNKRSRRDVSCTDQVVNNTCNLILVGDYSFFVNIGRKNPATAINHMLITINRVDQIFRKTCWPGVGKNIGVQVKRVLVHSNGYTAPGIKPLYNQKREGGWNVNKLLRVFSKRDWNAYCLAHLFTYQDFKDGVIGLATIGKNGRNGGICSRMNPYTRRCDNTGLSTHVNWNRPLTTLEANLVTAHEIGHNFGANHDHMNDKKCSPDEGGKYIMYPISVTGFLGNHESFSSCSGKEIGRVLSLTRGKCFTARGVAPLCTNSIVETGEECDEGLNEHDPCCKKCKLKYKNFTCSDHNSLCCKNCMVASTNTKCREEYSLDCQGETKCDGISKDCPTESPKLNFNECIIGFNKGKCRNGKCISFCSLNNSTSCKCTTVDDACKVCCGSSDTCKPLIINSSYINKTDGASCTRAANEQGLCMAGRCRKPEQDITDLLIRSDLVAYAVLLMEENIVLTILVFSLLIWIPTSIIVSRWDKRDSELYLSRKSLTFTANQNDPT